MSRIIKFRAWDSYRHRYYTDSTELLWSQHGYREPYSADGTMKVYRTDVEMFCPGDIGAYDRYDRERFTLQQFVNLIDKSGREIYEGDLVNFHIPGITHGREPNDVQNAEVYWSTEDACWMFGRYHVPAQPYPQGFMFGKSSEPYDWGYSMADDIDPKSLEVVGNIFETK